jgi:hypothetical protein
MVFDSYIDWYNKLLTMGLNDVILGVKDTIEDKTVYLSLGESKVLKMDNTSFIIGYTYNVVLSVANVDDPLVQKVGNILQSGLTMTNWSENSHLYNYTGSVYLPVGSGGEPWQ